MALDTKKDERLIPRKSASRLVGGGLLFLTILMAATPPALVVADRWLGIIHPQVLNSVWCRSDFLCHSVFPSYFLIIFGCTLVLPFLVFILPNKTGIIIENDTPQETSTSTDTTQARIGLVYQVVSIGFMLFFAFNGFFNKDTKYIPIPFCAIVDSITTIS